MSGYLGADHVRLKGILDDVARMVDEGEVERADHTYLAFYEGLNRHIRLEEELLFPMFEKHVAPRGPTDVMRAEHIAIKAALERMRRALDVGDAQEFREGFSDLDDVLPHHDMKEERIIYPGVDRALDEGARTEFVAKLRAY